MSALRVSLLTLGLVCLTLPVRIHAEQRGMEGPLAALLSQDRNLVQTAKSELLAARAEEVSALIAIVANDENLVTRSESVGAAMFVLGKMRAIEAAETLAANVAFPDVLPGRAEYLKARVRRPAYPLGHLPLSRRPAAEALVNIGEPSLPAVIEKLATTGNVTEQVACLQVLHELRGDDSARALEHALACQEDPKKRERLRNSLEFLFRIKWEGGVSRLGGK